MASRDSFTVFDPIHKVMKFEGPLAVTVRSLVDTREFQRLRRIKQLGLTDLVFPSATHTRFLHSLGAAWIANQICRVVGASEEETEVGTLALLLHDIGHGPFSHTFEKLMPHELTHEDWSRAIIEQRLQGAISSEVIQQISALLTKKKRGWLQDLVSSQLDADRIDYLLRDSHSCGVEYGSFDLHWLLRSLVLGESNGEKRLGVDKKGVGVAEHLLLARRLSYHNIYLNPKVRILDRLFIQFLKAAQENLSLLSQALERPLYDYLSLISKPSLQSGDALLSQALDCYLKLTDDVVWRSLFRVNEQFPSHLHSETFAQLAEILCSRKNLPIALSIPQDIPLKTIKAFIDQTRKQQNLQTWELDLVGEATKGVLTYSEEETEVPIFYRSNAAALHKESPLIQRMSGALEPVRFIAASPHLNHDEIIKNIKN